MPLPSEQYAFLSSRIYGPLAINDEIHSDVHQYKILYVSPPSATNYRGAVFQEVDTGQLIVANKGTDPSNIHDCLADWGMGLMGVPTQWPEAAATMRWVLGYANELNIPLSQISVTGHSLGGAEAQLQAAMFGVYAETFNAYGAASMARHLGMNVKAAESHVINHRMHHDPVSAMAEPIGRSVDYMDHADYRRHERGGLVLLGEPGAVVAAHGIDNFWDKANNRPAAVFAHNYMQDLHHHKLDDLSPGMPMDMPWHGLSPHASLNPRLDRPLAASASVDDIFDRLCAVSSDQQLRQVLGEVAHADVSREWHAQAAERVDMENKMAAMETQLQQTQQQLMAQQVHPARSMGMSR